MRGALGFLEKLKFSDNGNLKMQVEYQLLLAEI